MKKMASAARMHSRAQTHGGAARNEAKPKKMAKNNERENYQ